MIIVEVLLIIRHLNYYKQNKEIKYDLAIARVLLLTERIVSLMPLLHLNLLHTLFWVEAHIIAHMQNLLILPL